MKNIGKKIVLSIPPRLREIIIICYLFLKYFNNYQENIKNTREALNIIKLDNPLKYQNSKKALWRYCFRQISAEKCTLYLETYKKDSLQSVQRLIKDNVPHDEPIFVCAVKNDLHRVKMQVNHHESLGIKNFVYIDNMSDDGTFEWLLERGVDVYRVDDPFSATAKNAWIRQITDIYGYDRWYLILDSDELFVYPNMEKSSINNLINFAKTKKIKVFQSFMIDMYSKDNINEILTKTTSLDDYDIQKNHCYFDTDSYYIEPNYKGVRILGGPRSRVFSDESVTFTPLLTKNALVYLQKEDIFSVHHSMPFYKNYHNPIFTGLLHYKFLPTDNKKITNIAKQGNYSMGSAEYKQYLKILKENNSVNFYYKKSQKFSSSLDLLEINIFDKEYSYELLSFLDKNNVG